MDALARAALNARRQGISYGQYMAQQREKGCNPLIGGEGIQSGFAKCEICGKPFLKVNRKRVNTCSERCAVERGRNAARERYWKNLQKTPGRTANCVICGKEFQTRLSKQITCSEECSIKRRLWREEQYEMRKMSK